MKNSTKLALTLTCAAVLGFTSAPAKANDLINSSVSGYVGGDITQEVEGYGANADLQVGSIDTEFSYPGVGGTSRNLEAQGRVGGDVTQVALSRGGWISPDFKLEAHVGNIQALAATNSKAFGSVDGDITQFVDAESSAEIHVGSMVAEGVIENSSAEGFVGGDITQYATNGAKASARIGSLR